MRQRQRSKTSKQPSLIQAATQRRSASRHPFSHPITTRTWARAIDGWIDAGATQIVFRPQDEFTDMLEKIDAFAPAMAAY